jgi:hypothetical protein
MTAMAVHFPLWSLVLLRHPEPFETLREIAVGMRELRKGYYSDSGVPGCTHQLPTGLPVERMNLSNIRFGEGVIPDGFCAYILGIEVGSLHIPCTSIFQACRGDNPGIDLLVEEPP